MILTYIIPLTTVAVALAVLAEDGKAMAITAALWMGAIYFS